MNAGVERSTRDEREDFRIERLESEGLCQPVQPPLHVRAARRAERRLQPRHPGRQGRPRRSVHPAGARIERILREGRERPAIELAGVLHDPANDPAIRPALFVRQSPRPSSSACACKAAESFVPAVVCQRGMEVAAQDMTFKRVHSPHLCGSDQGGVHQRDDRTGRASMRWEKTAVLLHLARALAGSSEGLTLDEMARSAGVERRTAERMRDSLALLFPQLEDVVDGRGKRFRIPGGLDGFLQVPAADELAELSLAARHLEATRQRRSRRPPALTGGEDKSGAESGDQTPHRAGSGSSSGGRGPRYAGGAAPDCRAGYIGDHPRRIEGTMLAPLPVREREPTAACRSLGVAVRAAILPRRPDGRTAPAGSLAARQDAATGTRRPGVRTAREVLPCRLRGTVVRRLSGRAAGRESSLRC